MSAKTLAEKLTAASERQALMDYRASVDQMRCAREAVWLSLGLRQDPADPVRGTQVPSEIVEAVARLAGALETLSPSLQVVAWAGVEDLVDAISRHRPKVIETREAVHGDAGEIIAVGAEAMKLARRPKELRAAVEAHDRASKLRAKGSGEPIGDGEDKGPPCNVCHERLKPGDVQVCAPCDEYLNLPEPTREEAIEAVRVAHDAWGKAQTLLKRAKRPSTVATARVVMRAAERVYRRASRVRDLACGTRGARR